ncbi:MAG TPA: uroporphyrinogen-III synthase [Herpetosiphonaceae bacterium]|nr:uroporphyrinogen-III synthase [Herpetosiphonaceae bacterium]
MSEETTAGLPRAREAYLPLRGRRILVTRAEEQAEAFVRRLRDLGAVPVLCPTIAIAAPDDFAGLDGAIARLDSYDWIIFTSVNGVRFFFERLSATGRSAESLGHLQIGAIGPATSAAVAEHGHTVAFVPAEYVAESIVAGIGDVAGKRVLLPRADIARKALVEGLAAKGAIVDEVVAYRTVARTPRNAADIWAGGIDIATFTSPSTVQNFVALFEDGGALQALGGATIACIGPITAAAARRAGIPVTIVAPEHTLHGLVEALIRFIEDQA